MSSQNKSTSEGTKVDLGRNAPVNQENAGVVASDSLAAESLRKGGEFSNNTNIRSENSAPTGRQNNLNPTNVNNTSTSTTSSGNSGSNDSSTGGVPKSYAGTAPSYVDNQYIRDPHGPHGRNIQETSDLDDSRYTDGATKAMNAEPGSINDPSRVAELQFQQNQTAAGRDAGPRQGGLTNETKFDTLQSETSS